MMNDERYVRKGYKIWDTYSDKEVQELNYRYQSDYVCEILNEKESRINTLVKENEQLRQILKDIVMATDETYTKNTSMFKVTAVLDYEKYIEIRRCIK